VTIARAADLEVRFFELSQRRHANGLMCVFTAETFVVSSLPFEAAIYPLVRNFDFVDAATVRPHIVRAAFIAEPTALA